MVNKIYENFLWTNDISKDIIIDDLINNFFLKNENYCNVFFQKCIKCNKKINPLIIKGSYGERCLTIPGANEKDFTFYGCCDDAIKKFPEHIVNIIKKTKVDHIKIPLLSEEFANFLLTELNNKNTNILFVKNLSSIIPAISKLQSDFKPSISLKRSMKLISKNNLRIKKINKTPDNIQEMHCERWGNNRKESFFNYLSYLIKSDFSECYGICDNKKVIAMILNIKTSNTYHFYYSIFDSNNDLGIGTSVLGVLYDDFINNKKIDYFSFGRGAERYKFRYANMYYPIFEIKGFYIHL